MQLQKHFKELISDRPELLKKYVDTSLAALNYILVPINGFVRHLLEIQDLDPNTVPGQRELLALQQAFERYHQEEYDNDYDVSWVQKKFEKVRESSRWGDLTQETFVDLTDVSGLPARSESSGPLTIGSTEANQIAPESEKREIRIFGDMGQERDNLKTVLKDLVKKADQAIKQGSAFDPGDALARLAKAREVVEQQLKIADPIQQLADAMKSTEKSKPKKKSKKSGVKTSKKKLNKGGKGTRVNRHPPTAAEKQQYVAKKSSLKESIKAKVERSQELVDEMVAKGLVTNNKEAIQEQLQQVLLLNDDAIEALARIVKRHDAPSTGPEFKGFFRRVD